MTITTQGHFAHNLIGRVASSGEFVGEIVGIEQDGANASRWWVHLATGKGVEACHLRECIIENRSLGSFEDGLKD